MPEPRSPSVTVPLDGETERWLRDSPRRYVGSLLANAGILFSACLGVGAIVSDATGSGGWAFFAGFLAAVAVAPAARLVTRSMRDWASAVVREAGVPRPWFPAPARLVFLKENPDYTWVIIARPAQPRKAWLAVPLMPGQDPSLPIEAHGVPRRRAILIMRAGERVLWPSSKAYGGWYARFVARNARPLQRRQAN